MSVDIGIAGLGRHALGRILPVIEAHAELNLVAAWTHSDTGAAQLRERGIAGTTNDFGQFLAMPMDLVYVASPTGLHFEHSAAVLAAGLHAWVEKPIASSLHEARQLVAMAAAGGRMLTEAFMFPWHDQARVLRQALAERMIGELRTASFTFSFPHLDPGNFRYDPTLGGGAWLDHACYLVKALDHYLGGDWTLLGGCLDQASHNVDIAGTALLRRDTDGVLATLDWGFGRTYINEIQLTGEHGRLLVESAFTKPASRACNIILEDASGRRSTLPVSPQDPYSRMIAGFMQQFANKSSWQAIREDILRHAERYFALQALLANHGTPLQQADGGAAPPT